MTSVLPMPAREKEEGVALTRSVRVANMSLPESSDRVVYIDGKRLYFRPLDVQDEPLLRKWVNDPSVRRYNPHRGPLNSLREREFIESQGKNSHDYGFGVVVKNGDRLIGSAVLRDIDPVNRSAKMGINIGDTASQGRGYGREAIRLLLKYGFEELNLNRIGLYVFAENWRAIRAYQKAGFVQEGCARQAQFRDGHYQDEYHFAMLKSEWEASEEVSFTCSV
jgi:RimJ/RimL family protein N-acetyltransferase